MGALLMAVRLADTASAQGRPAVEPGPGRVRPADSKAAALLAAGVATSPTFKAIVESLDHSDLIVYVESRPLKLPGQLQLLAATPACRHVRVSIRTPGLDNERIAWLAHELWHGVELSRAPEVRDQAGLRRLYARIGRSDRYGDNAESAAAQEVWKKVLYEMQRAK